MRPPSDPFDPASVVRNDLPADTIALAVNLLRVVRGEGDPARLVEQCAAFVRSVTISAEHSGAWPERELTGLLDYAAAAAPSDSSLRRDPDTMAAIDTIVAGSLALAAGRLVDDRLAQLCGEEEIVRGLGALVAPYQTADAEGRPLLLWH